MFCQWLTDIVTFSHCCLDWCQWDDGIWQLIITCTFVAKVDTDQGKCRHKILQTNESGWFSLFIHRVSIPLIFHHYFGRWRPIFTILSRAHFQGNSLCICDRDFHLTLTISLYYLIKLEIQNSHVSKTILLSLHHFIKSFLGRMLVNEFWKLIFICSSYDQYSKAWLFFETRWRFLLG